MAARIVIVITVPLSLSGVRMGTIVLKSKSCDSNPIVTLLRPMAAGQANQVRAFSIGASGSRVACRLMCNHVFVFFSSFDAVSGVMHRTQVLQLLLNKGCSPLPDTDAAFSAVPA